MIPLLAVPPSYTHSLLGSALVPLLGSLSPPVPICFVTLVAFLGQTSRLLDDLHATVQLRRLFYKLLFNYSKFSTLSIIKLNFEFIDI